MTREHPDSLTRSADSTWEPRQRLSQQGGHGHPPPAHPAGAVTTGGTALRGHSDVSRDSSAPLAALFTQVEFQGLAIRNVTPGLSCHSSSALRPHAGRLWVTRL